MDCFYFLEESDSMAKEGNHSVAGLSSTPVSDLPTVQPNTHFCHTHTTEVAAVHGPK